MPELVRIKDGLNHGRRDRPDSLKVSGQVYIATDDEVASFGDKFVIFDRAQTVREIQGSTAERVISLVDGDVSKALFLIEIETEGKQRTTLIDKLNKIVANLEKHQSA